MLMGIRLDDVPIEYLGCIMSIITPTDNRWDDNRNQRMIFLCFLYANNWMIKAQRSIFFYLLSLLYYNCICFDLFLCLTRNEHIFSIYFVVNHLCLDWIENVLVNFICNNSLSQRCIYFVLFLLILKKPQISN